ncbi:NlpC/P60 family protein [Streptomyces sp. NPDC060366]|uniref:C40 family peptidase n=1 Tax=Streptomyces sp. NPDC060366 TaxID=3347105 RepID=UPI0036618526
MAQQTMLRPPRQAAQHKPRTAQAQVQAKKPMSHRKPQNTARTKRRDRVWSAALLVVMFVLSLVCGVLLAVHGPSSDSSSTEVRPTPTPAPAPQIPHGPEMPKPVRETPKTPDGTAGSGTAAVEKVTLIPGDTLYALAGAHGTSVKALQELNDLGTSTLIYAGNTLRVPAEPDSARSQMGTVGVDRLELDPEDMEPGEVDPAETDLPHNDPPKNDPPKKTTPKPDKPKKEAPTSGAKAKAVVAFARAQLGKPYVWGGTGPNGFDCSGLVMRAWEKAGVQLPRTTWGQVNAGKTTTRDNLVPGDLIISNNGGHVQLYIGDGKVIHAPGKGKTVTTAPLPNPSGVDSYRHITP